MSDDNYTGADNLEVMEAAVNYNRFLENELLKASKPGDKVLDFGAGIGTFAKRLTALHRCVDCLEIDPSFQVRLKESGLTVFNSINAVPQRSYDTVYSLNVLEHIEDDIAALKKIKSFLKPGGRLYLYVPAFNSLYSSMDKKVGHFRRYTKTELVSKVEKAGFSTGESKYHDSLGFFATLAFKLIGNHAGDISSSSVRIYDSMVFPLSYMLDRYAFAGQVLGKNVSVTALALDS